MPATLSTIAPPPTPAPSSAAAGGGDQAAGGFGAMLALVSAIAAPANKDAGVAPVNDDPAGGIDSDAQTADPASVQSTQDSAMAGLMALLAPLAAPPQTTTPVVPDTTPRSLAMQIAARAIAAADTASQGPLILPRIGSASPDTLAPATPAAPDKAAATVTLPDAAVSAPPKALAAALPTAATPKPATLDTPAVTEPDPKLIETDPSAQPSSPQPAPKLLSSPTAPAISHAATAQADTPAQGSSAAASTAAVPAGAGVTTDGGQGSDMADGRSRRESGAAVPPTDVAAKADAAAPAVAIDQPQSLQASAAAAQARATPQTVAHLAAQIVSKAGSAKATQFDVALDPQGLGRVNVSLRIASDGTLSAAMSFDTPQAAAELRARSDELQRALSQAGFNVADGALSFDVSGDSARQGGRQRAWTQLDFGADAFSAPLSLSTDAAPSATQLIAALRASRSGVDIRI